MLNFDAILVILVLIFILISLYDEIIGPAFTFVTGVIILTLFGVLTPKESIAGFSNEQIMVLIMLLLIGDVIRKTGVIDGLFDRIFKNTKSQKGFLLKMMIPVAAFSAFMNNTPLVAIMMPYVQRWSRRHDIPASKFLIPLSYAAILGGCATLIGTSTNLIVNGLLQDQTIVPDLHSIGLFEFAYVGVPMIIVGIAYLYFFSGKLLPSHANHVSRLASHQREYMVEAVITAKSDLIGKTIPESELVELKGLSLAEINRGPARIASTNSWISLAKDDILIFTGNTEAVSELVDKYTGLRIPAIGQFLKQEQTEVTEVVVSHNSSLVGKSVTEVAFRKKYDAVVLGVHRNGEKLMVKTATIKLKPGDVILLLIGPGFKERFEDSKQFYPLQTIREISKPNLATSILVLGGLAAVIIFSALHVFSLFVGLSVYLLLLLLTKTANPKEVAKSLDFDLGLIIVMALALGTAMVKTGLADMIAWGMIAATKPFGLIGVMIGMYLITTTLAAYITTKAAAAIIFPIALTTAVNLNVDPMPFVLITAFASAATFITPHGYQTNLMVYGPGGYRFKDFLRIGLPLNIIYMIVAVGMLYLVYF